MGRLKRIHYGSACYHVCARGNNRHYVFNDAEAKEKFLSILKRYQQRMNFKIYAYVIMGNHFHLLIEVQERFGVSKVMQGMLLSYSIWYRRRKGYVGHVWQGRFSSRLVEDDRQLAENISYIHQNPVKAGIVKNEIDYAWSTARIIREFDEKRNNVDGIMVSRYGEDVGTLLPEVK